MPDNSIAGARTISFTLPGYASESLYFLDQLVMMVAIKLKLKDGKKIPDNSVVGPINLPLTSIFSEVRVFIGKTQINPQAANYNYKNYLETLLNYDNNQKDTSLGPAGYSQVLFFYFVK